MGQQRASADSSGEMSVAAHRTTSFFTTQRTNLAVSGVPDRSAMFICAVGRPPDVVACDASTHSSTFSRRRARPRGGWVAAAGSVARSRWGTG